MTRDDCRWCGRDTSDGDFVNVPMPDGSIARCCSRCYEQADDDWRVDLDWRGEL